MPSYPTRGTSPVKSKTAYWVSAFILLLLLLPLPFGSNRPWASDLFALLTGALLAAMLWIERRNDPFAGMAPRKRLWLAAGLFTVVVIWSFLQVVPWLPESWHHPIWFEAASVLGTVKGSISIDPGVFPEALVRMVAYAGCFVLAFVAARKVETTRKMVAALALGGVAYALYGIAVQSAGSDTILWYKKWAYEGFLTSTFVNKNSYAAYAGLGLLCCITMLIQKFRNFTPRDHILARQSRFVAFIASLRIRDYTFILLPVILLAALAMTGSRAGVASTIIGGTVYLLSLAVNQRWQAGRWMTLFALGILVFVGFVSMGGDALLVRVDSRALGDDANTRLAAYELTTQAIRDNPWFGFGLGTFDSAFRLYRDSSLPLWFHHAHNDYLEMIMDLGIPAAILLFAAIGLVVSCSVSGVRKRRKDAIYPALALGATGLLGTHAFVDFSLHIPAIAATYATLLGIGAGQSWSSRTQQEQVPQPKTIIPLKKASTHAPAAKGKPQGGPKGRSKKRK